MTNFKQIFYSNFTEKNFPILPRTFARYKFLVDDFKSFFNYYILRKRKQIRPFPDSFSIFPTTICNANCIYCANRCLVDKREILPFEIFKKAADEFIQMGAKRIGLTPSPGEALIDPDFFNKVKYLKDKGITVALYTNAILFRNYLDTLVKSDIDFLHIDMADINPKYDSETFQITFEQSKERIQSVLDFLKRLSESNSNTKVRLDFRPIRTPRQIMKDMEKTAFWEYYRRGVFTMGFLQAYDNWGGQITQKDLRGNQILKIAPKLKKYLCEGFSVLSLLPNGDIRLCGCRFKKTLSDELVIGNIKESSIKEMLKSEKYKKVIENFYKGKVPAVCEECSFYRPRII